MKILSILILALLTPTAYAEKWVYVGTGKNNTHVYADKDSVSRKGDLASIKVSEGDKKSRVETMEFDCPNRMGLGGYGLREPIEKYAQFPMVKATFDLACRRWYEVWK